MATVKNYIKQIVKESINEMYAHTEDDYITVETIEELPYFDLKVEINYGAKRDVDDYDEDYAVIKSDNGLVRTVNNAIKENPMLYNTIISDVRDAVEDWEQKNGMDIKNKNSLYSAIKSY